MQRTRMFVLALPLLAVACSAAPRPPAPATPVAEAPPARRWPVYDAVPLIPRKVLFDNPEKTRPVLSPDGATLAYLAPRDGVLNVWVRTVGKENDRPITADVKRGIRFYLFAEDGKHILYLQDRDGDENWHVYATPLAGGETRDLTPVEGVLAQILAVDRRKPNTILVGLNERDRRVHDVYAVDLASGRRTLVQENDLGAIAWIADHSLQVRAALVPRADGGAVLKTRDSAKGKWRDLVAVASEDFFTFEPMGFAGDDRTLYVKSSGGSAAAELRAIDTRTGKERVIAGDATFDVDSVSAPETTHVVDAVAFERDRLAWSGLTPEAEKKLAAAGRIGDGVFRILSRSRDDRFWLLDILDDNGPGRYHVLDTSTGEPTFLFVDRPALEGTGLGERKVVSYPARDGLTIQAYLTLPVGVEPRNLPAVIAPHGGPWARDSWGYDGAAAWLANRGYVVLQPNFRGSTGYGKSFLNAADREWGGKMQDDITDGTRWLVEQGIVDPARICIMGGSYGGYATLMGLAREPDLYACGVNVVGVANLITWLQTIPPYWQPFEPVLKRRVGDPVADEAFLKSRSPVFLAHQIRAPLLIVQGKNDPRVPRAEAIQIKEAVERAGGRVQYVEYADEGHGFGRPENTLDFFARAEQFLAEHIGGRLEPL